MARRPTTIRRSLIRNLVVLITLTTGAVLVVTVVAGVRAVNRLSGILIDRAANDVEQDLARFFRTVETHTLVARHWAEAGLLDPTDVDGLNTLFVPILQLNPQFSSMMVASSEGEEYMLLRDPADPEAWINRIVEADRRGGRARYLRWNTSADEVDDSWEALDYDPRARIWYQAAIGSTPEQPIAWTRPAIFFTTKDPGLTAGTHIESPSTPDKTLVVAFDLLLLDISSFTTHLDVSEQGVAFVLLEDPDTKAFRVIGLPRDDRLSDDAAIRSALRFTPPDRAVTDAEPELPPTTGFPVGLEPGLEAWLAAGRPEHAVRFGDRTDAWWAGFRPFRVGVNPFWIGVAVPERDLLVDTVRRTQTVAAIALAALLIAVFMSRRLARSYGIPLEALADSSRRIGGLSLEDPVEIESHIAEVGQLAREQERMRVTLDSFSRYVPIDLVRQLLVRGEAARIGGSRQHLTILFTDIQGFTTISEATDPEELTKHLEEYFEMLLDIIRDHQGEVNQLLGDGVVAFWGAPNADEDQARHAVEAVLHCRDRLAVLNERWKRLGLPELPTRFGMAAGQVVVGNVGSPSRLAYAAVGDPVNLASRIEGLNRFYGTWLLAGEKVREEAGDDFEWRHVDGVRAKGKRLPVELYEPLGRTGEVASERLFFRNAYETALGAYRERDFERTIEILDGIDDPFRSELSVTRLRGLAAERLADSPPDDWDPITTFTEK